MANESIGKTNPRAVLFQVWDAGTNATDTEDISVRRGAQAIVQLDLTGFSGTFDIQGKAHPDADYVNLPYQRVDTIATPATAQISTTTITATQLYKILAPMPYMQIVMTRSAGTLAVYVYEYEDETSLPFVTVGAITPGTGATDLGKAEDAQHTSGDVGIEVLAVQTAAPADKAAEGDYAVVEVSGGRVWVSGGAPTADSSAASSIYAPVTSVVTAASIKASAGNVLKFHITNDNAAVRWFQLHNKASIPLATEAPLQTWKVPAGSATVPGYVEFEFKFGAAFSTGIGWAISTAQGVFTDAATASEHTVHVEYK